MSTPQDTLLFYTPGTCALACMIALETLGHPYDVCLVNADQRGTGAFKRFNPRGQVPALRVGTRLLAEVNAILVHVVDREPARLLLPPNGTWERDVANQWLSSLASGLHPAFWPFYHPERYTTDPGGHDAVKAAAVLAIRRELNAIDRHLAENEYILGSNLSALDGYVYAMSRWGTDMLDLGKDVPNVLRHYKALNATPVVRRCVAIERGRELPTPSIALRTRFTLDTLTA